MGMTALDPGLFADLAEESRTLPASWYHDPEVFRLEHESIFYRTWWYQCHETDVPDPGDYHAGEIADQGVVVIRGLDGEIRAFYNVCSHRAHPLVEGCGGSRLLVCPYHQWSYSPNGDFRGARGRKALDDWIPDNADLEPVRVESLGGFLFVNLDPDAVPLRDQTGRFLDDLREACPGLDDLVRVERHEVEIAANWKTVIDNNHECYHCNVNHPTLMELVDYAQKAVWTDSGITFTHGVERRDDANGAYDLTGTDIEQDAMFGYIWPTVIPLTYPGPTSLCMFQVLPTGPETTTERWDFYFAHRDLSDQERDFIRYIKEVLIVEDVGLCEKVQRGLHSRGYTQGRFVVDRSSPEYSEHHVHFFQKMVRDALLDPAESDHA
jgi:choline monooxygenase